MNRYILTTIINWEDIFRLNKSFLSSYIFRGQQNSAWVLESSIERAKYLSKFHWFKDYRTEEKWMLDEFMRKYHLYSTRQISFEDKFEWLSIMQHHGAPTRLLDFTLSIYIATYFAVIDSLTPSSVWMINRYILRDNLHNKYKLPYTPREALKDEVNLHNTNFANQFIARKYNKEELIPSTIVPLEPKYFSERLSHQQGLFLMPTNPEGSFMKNLESAFNKSDSNFDEITFDKLIELTNENDSALDTQVIKINIPTSLHSDIIHYMKDMNIISEVLFPGLDGLARSLFHTQVRT